MCQEFCSQGGSSSLHAGIPPWDHRQASPSPWGQRQAPPRADTPPSGAVHAVRYGQQVGGTHPT